MPVGSPSGRVLGYRLDGPGSNPGGGGTEIFLQSFLPRLVLGSSQLPIKMSTGGKDGRAQDQPLYLFLVPWLCTYI